MNQKWLIKWEFYLSKQEYAKFWLEKSQANQIYRKLNRLQKLGFVYKVANKRGDKNASVYQLLPNELIVPPWMMGNTIENKTKKTGNRMETNKESIKESNKIESTSPEEVEKLIASMKKINEELRIPFVSEDSSWYTDKLFSDQTYSEIIRPLEMKSKQEYPRREWIAKIYKNAMTNKADTYWKWKITSFKNLYDHLPKMANLF